MSKHTTRSCDHQLMGQQVPHLQPFMALHPWPSAMLAEGAAGIPGSSTCDDGAAPSACEHLVQVYAGAFGWTDKLHLHTW